jgi:Na+/Pi-cotransporter
MGTTVLLNLVGGIALLLWGLHMVQSGILRAFGADLRRVLAITLHNRFAALLAGIGATALLQSSTATALMTATFLGDGLVGLELRPANSYEDRSLLPCKRIQEPVPDAGSRAAGDRRCTRSHAPARLRHGGRKICGVHHRLARTAPARGCFIESGATADVPQGRRGFPGTHNRNRFSGPHET